MSDTQQTAQRRIHVGRRKSAVARARLVPGSGRFEINGRPLEDVFPIASSRAEAIRPLQVAEREADYDVVARIDGGGTTGQAGALSLAIARALQAEEPDLRAALKQEGLLTRDDRVVERKKYGLKKARKAPQYSKR